MLFFPLLTFARKIPQSVFVDFLYQSPNHVGIFDDKFTLMEASDSFTEILQGVSKSTLDACMKLALTATPRSITNCHFRNGASHNAVITVAEEKRTLNVLEKKNRYFAVHFVSIEVDLARKSSRRSAINADLFYHLCDQIEDYAIFMLDVDGKVMTWNKGAEKMLKYTSEEIIGRNYEIFFKSEDSVSQKPGSELAEAFEHGQATGECWQKTKDGRAFWASLTINRLQKNEKLIGYGAVVRDMTKLRDAYNEAAKLKTNFLATASHELRSPLNGVLAGIQLLATTDLTHEQDEVFSIIQQSGKTLSQLIDDLLIYTKLGAKKLILSRGPMDLRIIIRNLVSTYQLQSQRVQISSYIDDSVPQYTLGDATRFQQILSNLIDNANKFTNEGTINIEARATKHLEGKFTLHVSVEDTGMGMSQEALENLFQPFAQVDTSKSKRPGTGLGLSITKDLVHLMGGFIEVESEPEKGTKVIFTVLLEVDLKARPSIATTSTISNFESPLDIILAEDNLVNAKLLIQLLKKNGYVHVRHAVNGVEAVQEVMHKMPDLIFLDINMPLMDGYEAAAAIRRLNDKVPMIALSANAAPEDVEASKKAGMNDHMSKPIDVRKLITLIETYV